MTDKELLELAAKAAGIEVEWVRNSGCFYYENEETGHEIFDPLDDDGDALRLAVKLGITVAPGSNTDTHQSTYSMATGDNGEILERRNKDPYAATRRAIVRAAAEIGKGMK